jgi:hypothetical protein
MFPSLSSFVGIGSHGASKHVQLIPFPTVDKAIAFLHNECQCANIIGLLGAFPVLFSCDGYNVIQDDGTQLLRPLQPSTTGSGQIDNTPSRQSFPVSNYPFQAGNTCFAFGKHAHGLTATFHDCCNGFIHVPHEAIGTDTSKKDNLQSFPTPTSLLDSQACLSIVLHHYTEWAKYDERNFSGHKFSVANTNASLDSTLRLQQQQAREDKRRDREAEAETTMDDGLEILFHDG